jgi:hypothetical protein
MNPKNADSPLGTGLKKVTSPLDTASTSDEK